MPNNNKTAKVLVIIVTWNKKQYVLDLLSSLQRLDYPTDALDIVLVDNASTDGSIEAIKTQFPAVHLICNADNIGGTGGFNTGLQWAFEQKDDQYDYLWLLDNDVLVHRRALNALVDILDNNADIAVAGATMMQLDYPWRINEMGAFVNPNHGRLLLNRHFEGLEAWQSRSAENLSQDPDLDLSQSLTNCQPFMDVDYVAAASLVIRAKVAKQTGLWRDYFIHFDDVEWCLRIGKAGHRVVVSAQALIWHLSAAAKIPTWILYYDNRNVLNMMQNHGASDAEVLRMIKFILKKGAYYALLGKTDLSRLHYAAIDDVYQQQFGKKDIQLECKPQSITHLESLLAQKDIKRILIGPVNLQATQSQIFFVQAQLKRPDLQIDILALPHTANDLKLPRAHLKNLSHRFFKRWQGYWQLRNQYDLVIQSDYAPSIGLSWLNAPYLLFMNDENMTLRTPPRWQAVWYSIKRYLGSFFIAAPKKSAALYQKP